MARSLRIEYEGARYHVMSRGDRREAIYKGEEDWESFLKTLVPDGKAFSHGDN